jgi:hypothetical protein
MGADAVDGWLRDAQCALLIIGWCWMHGECVEAREKQAHV